MADFIAEATAARFAPESSRGVAPSTNWVEVQPDAGSLAAWAAQYTDVERNTYDKVLMLREGDHVSKAIQIQFAHDLNKDAVDLFFPSVYRCAVDHFGSTGMSLFRPTAVTSTGYTVASLGAISNNHLFYARGFSTSANNGLKLAAGTSTGTEIKCSGLTAEASPPANVTLDIVGYQGAAGDIELDVDGNLTSTSLDFTTLSLSVGMWIYLPTAAQATAMGSALYAFSNSAYAGRARIKTIAANKLTLERRSWTIGAATTETTSTVRMFFTSRLYRNYSLDNASYARPTLHGEKEMIDEGGTKYYEYGEGLAVNTCSISAPLNSKITMSLSFIGMDADDPVVAGSRIAGPSSAYAPLASDLIDAQNDLDSVRLQDSGGDLVTEFTEWTLTIDNKVSPKDVQGTFGAAGHKYGKFNYSVQATAYYNDPDVFACATENRAGSWDVLMKNTQYGILFDMPNVRMRALQQQLAADDIAMLSFQLVAFPNSADSIGCSCSVFGYLPA